MIKFLGFAENLVINNYKNKQTINSNALDCVGKFYLLEQLG